MIKVESKRAIDIVEAVAVLSPILVVVLAFIWFSIHAIAQSPNIDASIVNPIGFLISNFVYDGLINIENNALLRLFTGNLFLFP